MDRFTIGRKDLYEEIWSSSVMKVAEKHEISYSRLLSACKKYNIPIPPAGYSTKLEFGKAVERLSLPDYEEDTVVIEAPAERRKEKENRIPAVSVDDLTGDDVTLDESDDADKVPLLHYGDKQKEYREELYQKVWEKPVSEVAKEYDISDVALRKRCQKLEIPLPERGHWAKLKAGKRVHVTKLPELTTDFPKPHKGEKRKLHIESTALAFMKNDGKQEILSLASTLRVGGPGSKMLEDTQKLYDAFKEWHKPEREIYTADGYWISRRRESSGTPLFASDISPKAASRAFHILDALVRALLPYTGSLSYVQSYNQDNKPYFNVNDDRVYFEMSEGKDKVVHEITQAERMEMLKYEEAKRKGYYASDPRIPKYDHEWNGRLKMKIAGKYVFEDCKTYVLEDRIGEILIALYEASYPARVSRLEEMERLQKEIEEYQRKEKIREQRNEEVKKTKALMNKAVEYELACSVRKYIDAVRNDPSNPDNNPEWINWATGKADWLDPTICREDEILGKREHEKDADQKKLETRWY